MASQKSGTPWYYFCLLAKKQRMTQTFQLSSSFLKRMAGYAERKRKGKRVGSGHTPIFCFAKVNDFITFLGGSIFKMAGKKEAPSQHTLLFTSISMATLVVKLDNSARHNPSLHSAPAFCKTK